MQIFSEKEASSAIAADWIIKVPFKPVKENIIF